MSVPGRESTYYELLEIPPRASREEIQVAYNRARAAFAQNSLAVYSLFSADDCRDLQQRIEEAYRTLMNEEARRRYDETIGLGGPELSRPAAPARPAPPGPPPRPAILPPRPEPPASPRLSGPDPLPSPTAGRAPHTVRQEPLPPLKPGEGGPSPAALGAEPPRRPASPEDSAAPPAGIPDGAVVTGALLRKVRERLGISLRDISQTTKVSLTYLQFIEDENFQQLPVPAYLRGFLKAYAKCVGLDPERVSSEYIKLYALYHEIKSER